MASIAKIVQSRQKQMLNVRTRRKSSNTTQLQNEGNHFCRNHFQSHCTRFDQMIKVAQLNNRKQNGFAHSIVRQWQNSRLFCSHNSRPHSRVNLCFFFLSRRILTLSVIVMRSLLEGQHGLDAIERSIGLTPRY